MNTDKIYAESIAKEYAPQETSKVKQLKKLNSKAHKPANIFGYTYGSISSLILGIGMCLAMDVFETGNYMILGIVIGVIGIALCLSTYPIYKKILEHSKKKYAFEIVTLAKEITEQE